MLIFIYFCGHNVIVQAQSGTGKTTTFAIGILPQIDISCCECQALILVPIREFAAVTQKVIENLGDYLGVKVHTSIGGTHVRDGMNDFSSFFLFIKISEWHSTHKRVTHFCFKR